MKKNMYDQRLIAIGSKIREARLQKGLSQGELSELVGVDFKSICRYETGSRDISVTLLLEISNQLECAPSDFLSAGRSNSQDNIEESQLRLLNSENRETINRIISVMLIAQGAA